jgi:hypothetical protein
MKVGIRGVLAGAGLLAASAAHAELNVTAHANTSWSYDSNVFASPGTANSGTGASSMAYIGTLNPVYKIGDQAFSVVLEGRDYHYSGASLDHQEYLASGDWEWRLGPYLSGSAGINRSQQMVPFTSFFGTQLTLETNQNEHLSLGFNAGPNWRLQGGATTSRNDSPRPGLPDLSEVSQGQQVSLQYVGFAHLTTGVSAQYTTGHFEGTAGTTTIVDPLGRVLDTAPYHQMGAQLSLGYTLPVSSLSASVGYAKRASAVEINQASGITGNITYQRALTGRTNLTVGVARNINTYITNAGTEIGTTASAQLGYRLTHKISLGAGLSYTLSNLPAQGIGGTDRLDHSHGFDLNMQYAATKYLAFSAFAHYSSRTSDLALATYTDHLFGISATLNFGVPGAH